MGIVELKKYNNLNFKNSVSRLNSRTERKEERIIELDDLTIESTQSE